MPPLRVKGYLAALNEIIRQNDESEAFRVYVADSLHLRGENKYITARYSDLIDRAPEPEPDGRSCEEITRDLFSRIRGEKPE